MATILVVEDELDVQRVIAKRLSDRGFTVHCAADGYQAVEAAHRVNPDLIVLDLQLPAGGGLSVLRKVRKSGNTQRAHIVVLTGLTNEDYKQEAFKEGIDAYLQKPYNAEVLLDTIDRILKEKDDDVLCPVDSGKKDSHEEELPLFAFADKHQTDPSTDSA